MEKRKAQRFESGRSYFNHSVVKRKGVMSPYDPIVIKDISSTGICFETTSALVYEEPIVLGLENIYGENFRFMGKVARCAPHHRHPERFVIGVEFTRQNNRTSECQLLHRLGASHAQLHKLNCHN